MKVAIDGFAGSGKSTIAKKISKELGILYIDTGAMYRIVTLYYLNNNKNVDEDLSIKELSEINIKMTNDKFLLNDDDVSLKIRDSDVTNNVAKVAAHKNVREILVEKQREIASEKNVVLDGRDIGTVVFPDAKVKIFLTASVEQRAKRRHKQLKEMGMSSDYLQQIEDIKKRDYLEINRELSPLKKAADAIEIDSSKLTEDEVYEKIKEIVDKAIAQEGGK